jgi:CubicO group peptidase (beta-lactamase class C family)
MSSERLARIDIWRNGIVRNKDAAGFVALVARRGKVVHHKAYGTRGLSVAEPMPLDALFDLASMTKPVTVAAALMLLEEGRFTLNDPVGDYLPEFARPVVETRPGVLEPSRRGIRVRDLFNHTSGVFSTRSRAEMFQFPTLADHMRDLAKQPLRYEPGSTYLYGTSHDVLGYLVEKVSGTPLDRFVQDRVLAPLEMNDTHYWPPESKDARRAILVVRIHRRCHGCRRRRPKRAATSAAPADSIRPRGTTGGFRRCSPTAGSSTAGGCQVRRRSNGWRRTTSATFPPSRRREPGSGSALRW